MKQNKRLIVITGGIATGKEYCIQIVVGERIQGS